MQLFGIIALVFQIGIVVWIYNDAQSRSMNGVGWAIFAFVFPGLSVLIYALAANSKTAWYVLGGMVAFGVVSYAVLTASLQSLFGNGTGSSAVAPTTAGSPPDQSAQAPPGGAQAPAQPSNYAQNQYQQALQNTPQPPTSPGQQTVPLFSQADFTVDHIDIHWVTGGDPSMAVGAIDPSNKNNIITGSTIQASTESNGSNNQFFLCAMPITASGFETKGDRNMSWSTSSPATVSLTISQLGTVLARAISPGTATITATNNASGKSGTVIVNVSGQ